MKSNTYKHTFVVECPNNAQQIIYSLQIVTDKTVMVEHILTACALFKRGYHEDIADQLHERFGGHQVITANHHGVQIETVRG